MRRIFSLDLYRNTMYSGLLYLWIKIFESGTLYPSSGGCESPIEAKFVEPKFREKLSFFAQRPSSLVKLESADSPAKAGHSNKRNKKFSISLSKVKS